MRIMLIKAGIIKHSFKSLPSQPSSIRLCFSPYSVTYIRLYAFGNKGVSSSLYIQCLL